MTVVSLWDTQEKVSPVAVKPQEVKKEPPVDKVIIKEQPEVKPQTSEKEEEFYILAGKNRLDRQLYLFGYKDCDDYAISVVPQKFNKKKCEKLIKKATADLSNRTSVFGRTREVPKFEIISEKEYQPK